MPVPNYNTTYQFLQDMDPYVLEELNEALRNKPSIARINTPAWFNSYLTQPTAGLAPRTNIGLQALLGTNQDAINNRFIRRNDFKNSLTQGDALGGITTAALTTAELVGDAIQTGKGTFTKDSLEDFNDNQQAQLAAYNKRAGQANTTSDLINLTATTPDFIKQANDITTQKYSFGKTLGNVGKGAAAGFYLGSVVPGIGNVVGTVGGAIVGGLADIFGQGAGIFGDNKRKASAQGQANQLADMGTSSVWNAQDRVRNKTYNFGMANYLNNAAMGGPLSTHGADFTDDLIRIDAGGTHEQNPLGGVPAGVDPQGIPNLVEEGETIWDDYVFSDRLKAPKALVKKYALGGGKKGLTYSQAARKISEKTGAEMRPNDPISKRTKEALLTELEESQEEKRMAMQQRQLVKAMSEMSPEEFQAVFSGMQEPQPMETMVSPQEVENTADAEPLMQEPVGYEPEGLQGFAFGGPLSNLFGRTNLYVKGGPKYGRTKDGQLVQIIERTDGDGTTWNQLIPVEETGSIDSATIVSLPEVLASYQRPVQTSSNVFTHPYGEGFGGGARGGESNKVYAFKSVGANGIGVGGGARGTDSEGKKEKAYSNIPAGASVGGGARGNIMSTPTGKVPPLKPEVSRYVDPEDFIGQLNEVVVEAERPTPPKPFRNPNSDSSGGSGGAATPDTTWTPNKIFSISSVSPVDTYRSRSVMFNPQTPRTAIQKAVEGTTPTDPENTVSVGAQKNKMLPTWMRYAPVVGGGLSVSSDLFSRPDYSEYENLIADSRRLSEPVSIPVETIGNRLRRNPFDERLMVNQANQNLAAGLRSTRDNAGGNRAYRQFANNLMAYNNQAQLSDIARNAYLANRQDALQTADFNRGTDMFNAQAINQRNLAEAQLNSGRGYQGFMARANAFNALENARRYDDQMASADMTAFLTSLQNVGSENEWRNWLTSLTDEGVLNYLLGRSGKITFSPDTSAKNGGKIKTKKRRF